MSQASAVEKPSLRATRALLAICFFLSGGAGLVYEVLWSRHLHLLFGSTTESVAAVLATFMAGLGLGGHLLGRTADRSRSPMRLYGLLEIGVGLYAFLTPALLVAAQHIYAAFDDIQRGPHFVRNACGQAPYRGQSFALFDLSFHGQLFGCRNDDLRALLG